MSSTTRATKGFVKALDHSSRRLALMLRKNYALLDLRDLDATWPNYAAAAGYSVRAEHEVSTAEALLYFLERLLSLGQRPPSQPTPRPFSPGQVQAFLRLTGPIHIRQLIDNGWEEQAAYLAGLRRTVLWLPGHVHADAQQAVIDAGKQANDEALRLGQSEILQGHLRVLEPGACAFCRRLAGATEKIGLVYNVTAKWRTPHPNCKCTIAPQPVYKTVRVRSAAELALGQQMYESIKASRDRAIDRARELAAAA